MSYLLVIKQYTAFPFNAQEGLPVKWR